MTYQYSPPCEVLSRARTSSKTSPLRHSSPLRHASNDSTNSSDYSAYSNSCSPSRTSTMSSATSSNYQRLRVGHKRGISETSPMGPFAAETTGTIDPSSAAGYRSVRQSLRPLPQPPNSSSPPFCKDSQLARSHIQSLDRPPKNLDNGTTSFLSSGDPPPHTPPSYRLGRADSVKPLSVSKRFSQTNASPLGPMISPDLTTLTGSSTGHLKTLSKFAQQGTGEDFSLTTPGPSVVGLLGRRQLKRTDSTTGSKTPGRTGHEGRSAWAERNWMERQRQFLQAYEYLCHIGEAKEWIEDIIHKPLPPIVQLEEALRDGVTLAEIVQALHPHQPVRIFRHPKLQYRHSDNIAVFFRFLAQVELPELFRFELIDLYEKKNIPKVIHCIHALSWLLYRKGIVDFRIGNLVGQLEFEHHELEEMQKGLDKAGVSMPSFAGMDTNFSAGPEPVPEPIPEPESLESENERIERELHENEAMFLELQAQMRGAMIRIGLGQQMQYLWDSEERLADLQAIIRGTWGRQVFQYRLGMNIFATDLQSHVRGFLERRRHNDEEKWCKAKEKEITVLQSLVRARTARQETRYLKQSVRKEESGVKWLQAAIRGALERKWLGEQLECAGDAEVSIQQLQAAIRGALQRKHLGDQLEQAKDSERDIQKLQAAIRGALQRKVFNEQGEQVKDAAIDVQQLQAAIRGAQQRDMIIGFFENLRQHETSIKTMQSSARAALQRKRFAEQLSQVQQNQQEVIYLQSALRGMLQRRAIHNDRGKLRDSEKALTTVQAAARGRAIRSRAAEEMAALKALSGLWRAFQAISRGLLLRKKLREIRRRLASDEYGTIHVQAALRGRYVREKMDSLKASLSSVSWEILMVQSASRAFMLRKRHFETLQNLHSQTPHAIILQGCARGWLIRQANQLLHQEIFSNTPEIVNLQALSRAMVVRREVGLLLDQLDDEESATAELQSNIRGLLVRARFAEKQRYFKENMEKVVKVQSFIRGRLQGEAYKSLTNGTNPPVGTVKGFVHLLNDSDFDFDEEVEFERLRKTVVQHVRQNELADQYITQLDIKIALLVKNKITLDEVVKHQKHFGGDAGKLLTNTEISSKDPFDLKALNKASRRKLEQYQELFFILQTQPQYLARLFKRFREQATAEKECERIKHLIMGLFGYAQKRREEYYLLKLITRSMKEEIDRCPSLKDYLRGNFFWAKLFAAYVKSPRDRKYLRDILGPVIQDNILDTPDLDLESDPMLIYLSAIENEQLRTGRRSKRSPDIPREEAIRDEETKRTFIAHLQDLRDIADQFFAALEDQLHKMPFGVRYIAQQMFESLISRFKHEERGNVLQIVGYWVWRNYLQPALTEPEKFGVLDRGLSQDHRRNIGEVGKVLGQVAAGRLFGGENVFLQPLNSYVGESIQRVGNIWQTLIAVPNAEVQFDIDEFNDLYARTKPTLYIKMIDIFSIHHLVAGESSYICPNHDDMLREIIRELGSAKSNEHELMSFSTSEICLTLNPKLHDKEDPDAEAKALFMETKRCILYIIRVQSGSNLMEIMVKPITMEDVDRWEDLVREELSAGSRKRSAYSEANTIIDIASMSYAELKRTALENILRLEQAGRLTRHNHYQDLLNAIAVDIRTKHRRRIQRQRELEGVRLTLARLNDQALYLEQQLKTYNDYIEQAMVTLQNKKGKKRFLMPFTKQWDHERELQRSGRVPKFGSFKYSAQELAHRGILVSWRGYSERQWAQLDLTIWSNEVGVFSLEGSNGSIAIPGASAQVPLDDLLQAQFNNTQFLEFFSGVLRVNVNLFVHLIMRKFYKDGDS